MYSPSNKERARLGVDIVPDGELGAASVRGFASLAGKDDAQAGQAVAIPLGSVLWLPGERVEVTTCAASLGSVVESLAWPCEEPGRRLPRPSLRCRTI